MVFRLTMSSNYISENNPLFKEYERIGFKFIDVKNTYCVENCPKMVDLSVSTSIEIKTIEELLAFINKFGAVVISRNEIEIYNDYRE